MGFNLAGLAALGQGYMQGQDQNVQRQQQRLQLMQQKRAETARGLSAKFMSDPDNPFWQQLAAGPTPGGSAPAGGAPPPPAAGAPMPPGGGPGMAPGGPAPGGAPGPGGAPMGGPAPAPPPGQQPLGPGSLSGAAQPSGDPYLDALRTTHSIYMSIKKANPGADDATVAEAAQQVLASTKGLNPEIQAQSKAMLEVYRQGKIGERQERGIEARSSLAETREGWRRTDAKTAQGFRKALEDARAGHAMARAQFMSAAADGRLSQSLGARWKMLQASLAQRAEEFKTSTEAKAFGQQAKDVFSEQAANVRELAALSNLPPSKERDAKIKATMDKLDAGEKKMAGLAGPDPNDTSDITGGDPDLSAPAPAPAPAAAPKPAAAQGGGGTPPAGALSEGHNTTFANGQTWTLKNGKPVRVK